MPKFNYSNIREMFITSDMTFSSYTALLITIHYMKSEELKYVLMMAGIVILSNCYNHYLTVKKKIVIRDRKYISFLIMVGVVFTYLVFNWLAIEPSVIIAAPFYLGLFLASLEMGFKIKDSKKIKDEYMTEKRHKMLSELYHVFVYGNSYYYSTKNNYYYNEHQLFKNKTDLSQRRNGVEISLLMDITDNKNLNDINEDDLLITKMVEI